MSDPRSALLAPYRRSVPDSASTIQKVSTGLCQHPTRYQCRASTIHDVSTALPYRSASTICYVSTGLPYRSASTIADSAYLLFSALLLLLLLPRPFALPLPLPPPKLLRGFER
eukprot:3929948-Rhodomonas_salina.2